MYPESARTRLLGQPLALAVGSGLGLTIGVFLGIVIGVGQVNPALAGGILIGFTGFVCGAGLGSFAYTPRWALIGFLIAFSVLASMIALMFGLQVGNARLPQTHEEWIVLAGVFVFFCLNGAAGGGACKLVWDQRHKLLGWSYSQRSHHERMILDIIGMAGWAIVFPRQILPMNLFSPAVAWLFFGVLMTWSIYSAVSNFYAWRREVNANKSPSDESQVN